MQLLVPDGKLRTRLLRTYNRNGNVIDLPSTADWLCRLEASYSEMRGSNRIISPKSNITYGRFWKCRDSLSKRANLLTSSRAHFRGGRSGETPRPRSNEGKPSRPVHLPPTVVSSENVDSELGRLPSCRLNRLPVASVGGLAQISDIRGSSSSRAAASSGRSATTSESA